MSVAYPQTSPDLNLNPNQFSSQALGDALGNTNNASNNASTNSGKKASRMASDPLLNATEEPSFQSPTISVSPVTLPATPSANNQIVEMTASSNKSLLNEQVRNDRDRTRNPGVALPVELLNKKEIRVFLELVKGCFGSRLPDEAILDTILRVAVVDDEKLAGLFCADFAEPLYIPDENEGMEAILAKLANIKRPNNDEENAISLNANASTPRANTSIENKERTYRVPISPLTLRILINCQRSLTSYLYYRVDINALAAKIIDIGNYNAKQVITEIRNHFRGLQEHNVTYR